MKSWILAARAASSTSARVASAGVVAPALSDYFISEPKSIGLMLGYAAVREEEIDAGVGRIVAALERPSQ